MDPVKLRTGLIAIAAAFGLGAAVLLVAGLTQVNVLSGSAGSAVRPPIRPPGNPSSAETETADDVPEAAANWTHRELLALLRSKGLQFVVVEPPGGITTRPARLLMPEVDPLRALSLPSYPYTDEHWKGCALVEKWPTATQARDQAGLKGEYAFSWGCFVFTGDKGFLAQIRRVLP